MTDTLDALERLARLHQSGALTDAEFAEQKARVLRSDGADRSARQFQEDDEAPGGGGSGKLLIAALGAALLGVVVWWQLVDSDGQVKPVPTPGTVAASGKPETGSAKASEAPTASPVPDAPLVVETGTAPMPVTYNPSFSCSGQDERTLVMICESPALSRKDRELSGEFKALLRSLDPEEREAVLRQQRAFLRERSACADVTCLGEWYDRTLAHYRDG